MVVGLRPTVSGECEWGKGGDCVCRVNDVAVEHTQPLHCCAEGLRRVCDDDASAECGSQTFCPSGKGWGRSDVVNSQSCAQLKVGIALGVNYRS